MTINIRMSHFDSNFLTLIDSFIYLTHRSRSEGFLIKFFKYLTYFFAIHYFEIFLRLFKRVLRGIFTKMYKFVSHLRTNYISPMTHILESFDPDNSCELNRFDKQIHPHFSCFVEKTKRIQ